MSKKLLCFALCVMLFALSVPVEAQQPGKVYRIGFLSSGPAVPRAFRQGLRELGYDEPPRRKQRGISVVIPA